VHGSFGFSNSIVRVVTAEVYIKSHIVVGANTADI
jgi:hypothetical protein